MTEYAWIDGYEAYCFTVIHGLLEDDVIRRLGGNPSDSTRMTFEECFWFPDKPQWVQVGTVGSGAVLVAEHNGWRGSDDDALALSKGARMTSFFRNVHAVMWFGYAADGALLAGFDPLLEKRPEAGADPRCLDALLTGLDFGLDAAEPNAMMLLERVTGVQVGPNWLGKSQRAVCLPPLR